jgi:predicted TIM-barrel fold metal-dependent hydrolase
LVSGQGQHHALKVFDAHMHVFDPRFPIAPNNGYLPDPFTVDDYHKRIATLPVTVTGGAVVSASTQGFDQTYLIAALQALGPTWVGVTQVPVTASDDELRQLDAAGVRAIRFNLRRGGGEGSQHMVRLAQRVHDLVGWHVELYIDGRELPAWESTLRSLPAVSVDHLGLSTQGLTALIRLAASGVHVKASGFGRVDFPVPTALRQLYDANPDALLFGTDLPSPRAPRPFTDTDLDQITNIFNEDELRRILHDNAVELYRPATAG